MSQQSARQAARRSASDAHTVLRKQRADRERRLGTLAAGVLNALGERDGAVQDAERRAGFRYGLLVALIRPVIGHGHAAQLECQRPARQVREPNASGSQSSSNSISSCTFMITSTSPGWRRPGH
jgi:hypothetical protein